MLSALLLAFMLQGAPTPSAADLTQFYALFIDGQVLADEGDLAGAIAKYRQALTVVPGATDVRAELANAYAEQGDLTGAEAEASRVLAASAENRAANRLLGLIVASRVARAEPATAADLIRTATTHLEKVTPLATRDLAVMLTLGELYVRAERYPAAIAILEQFLVDRPGYPQAVMLLADAYRSSGRPDAAQALINGLGDPGLPTPESRRREAAALSARGEWREASVAWSEVLKDDPRDTGARLQYAAALANGGDLASARGELTALTRDDPEDVGGWHLLALVELRAGRLQMAEEAARRIETMAPSDSRGPLTLASVRAERDDYRGVVAILERRVMAPLAADIAGGAYAEMAVRLADAWMELDSSTRAIGVLSAARARVPDDLRIAFSLAATYERSGDVGKAERAFREVIAADPEHAGALNYLGYMLADRGKKLPEALSLIERALKLDPDNASYLDSLGWVYYRMKRYADAVAPLERAAADAADSSVIQEHLGDAYAKVGRTADAVGAYERALGGDRAGIDAAALAKKRDRARASAGPR